MAPSGPPDPVFETVRVEAGRVRLWDRHLLRLRRAGALPAQLTAARALLAVHLGAATPIVARIDVDADRPVALRTRPVPDPGAWRLATVPGYDPDDAARERKLARREWIAAGERGAAAAGADEPLFAATVDAEPGPDARIGETARANLFLLDAAGRVATAPVAGLLPGVTRGWALEAAGAAERALTLADARAARAAFCTNAARGIVPVAAIDGRPLARDPLVDELAAAWSRLP